MECAFITIIQRKGHILELFITVVDFCLNFCQKDFKKLKLYESLFKGLLIHFEWLNTAYTFTFKLVRSIQVEYTRYTQMSP